MVQGCRRAARAHEGRVRVSHAERGRSSSSSARRPRRRREAHATEKDAPEEQQVPRGDTLPPDEKMARANLRRGQDHELRVRRARHVARAVSSTRASLRTERRTSKFVPVSAMKNRPRRANERAGNLDAAATRPLAPRSFLRARRAFLLIADGAFTFERDPIPSALHLSDHDTEEEAARAFDRAAINKAGASAQTNYPVADYASEMESLQRVSVVELVATLRAKARRHGTQTSRYRGVSLLKQTGKWHGQINVGGKQLHLGFFDTEELAARAYDRAAIHKAFAEGGVVVTNLDVDQYAHEMDKLRAMTRAELLAMIADEKRGHGGVEKSGDGEKMRAAPGERRDRSARAAASAKSRRGSAATREKETGNAGSGGTSANSRGSSEARPGSGRRPRGVRRRGRIRRVRRDVALGPHPRRRTPRGRGVRRGAPRQRRRRRARERGRIDAHEWKRRRLGGVIADAHVRRRAAFRVAVGRRTRGRRRRSRGAVRREEGNHPGGLIGRRARDEREGDEREEGHETVGGSADAPAVAASAREPEADETGPAPIPVCGVSLSSSARGIYHIIRRYDAVVERRVETCM